MRFIMMVLGFLLVSVPQIQAEPVDLTADEIYELLNGQTAMGPWGDDLYRQLFQTNGRTIYAPKGQRSTLGGWRVNSDTHKYESEWGQGRWESYGVVREDGQLFWVTSGGKMYPFVMLEGDQLLWPKES